MGPQLIVLKYLGVTKVLLNSGISSWWTPWWWPICALTLSRLEQWNHTNLWGWQRGFTLYWVSPQHGVYVGYQYISLICRGDGGVWSYWVRGRRDWWWGDTLCCDSGRLPPENGDSAVWDLTRHSYAIRYVSHDLSRTHSTAWPLLLLIKLYQAFVPCRAQCLFMLKKQPQCTNWQDYH